MTRKEQRRDRRYGLPVVHVWIGEEKFVAHDWSLGGFSLEAAPPFDVGALIVGRMEIEGLEAAFDLTAEVVRAPGEATTLGCHFVNPSSELLAALDTALVARFFGKRRQQKSGAAKVGALVAASLLLAAQAALAAGTTVGGGDVTLVPGSAPLPEFHLNFPDLMARPPGLPAPDSNDLQISVTGPDKSVVQFLFSPRPQFGIMTDRDTGTSRSFAGVSWNLFENDGFFSSLGFSGSLTRPGVEDMYRRYYGAPLALHSTFELGYQLGDNHSLTLQLDHSSTPDFLNDRSELNNFRLQYGLKF